MKKNYNNLVGLVVLSGLINIAYANDTTCESNWSVTAKGMKIGVTTEQYINHNNTFEIHSHFKPYAAVAFFGVPELIRTALGNQEGQLIYRKEIVNPNSDNKIIEWKMVANNKWQKTVNGINENPVDTALPVIDSTMFPYLLMLKKTTIASSNNFIAMGKDDPYPINFKMAEQDSGYQLESSVDSGMILFNKNNEPVKFGATQKGAKIVGTRISWNCAEK